MEEDVFYVFKIAGVCEWRLKSVLQVVRELYMYVCVCA